MDKGNVTLKRQAEAFQLGVYCDIIKDLLIRYLFGDSCIYTGNDNSDDEDNMCYCAEATIWGDNYETIPNPNHDAEHYDYFFKGN